jgi:hypothetical protein
MERSLNLNWAAGSLAVMVGLPMVFDPLGANGAYGQTVRFQTGTVETTTVTTTTIQVGTDSARPAVVYRESVTTPNVVYAQPGYPYGGVYNSGVYNPGVYNPGVYNGGVYNGGVYNGGVYSGGVYNGGVYSGGIHNGGHHPGRTDRDDRFRGPVIVVPVYPPIIQYRTVTIPLESTLNPPACAPPSDGKLRPSFSLSGC